MKVSLFAVVVALSSFLSVSLAAATELRIHFEQPPHGQAPVLLDGAELLVVAHNDTERIPLIAERVQRGRQVELFYRVPLDLKWLATKWSNAKYMEAAYIYLRSKGPQVSIRSLPFKFLDPDTTDGPPRSEITIDFGQGQTVGIRDGETQDVVLHFRTPEPRALRFVDDANRPVTDIAVSAYMFWSAANHCGVLTGAEPLVERVRPNAAGIVTLPDGDFEYAFTVDGRHLEVRDPHWESDNSFFTAYLTEPEHLVQVHRHKRYAVSLQVLVGDQPASGVELSGTAVGCGCGACAGSAGTLDSSGKITLADFYPDETMVCLVDESDHLLWSLAPQPARQTVRLPQGTTFMQSFCGTTGR